MQESSARKRSYLDPLEMLNLYKLNHIQLDVALRNIKDRIDR